MIGIGIGIGRYKPSGLRDWEKIVVGIAGLKNPIEDPPTKVLLSLRTLTQDRKFLDVIFNSKMFI